MVLGMPCLSSQYCSARGQYETMLSGGSVSNTLIEAVTFLFGYAFYVFLPFHPEAKYP